MPAAELFASAGALHAEGPFWDERNARLLFADALAGAIVAVEMTGLTTRFQLPSPVVTVIRRRTSGGYAVATEHGLSVCDESFSMCDSVAQLTSDTALRNNDGGCDPFGGFVVGTMAYGETTGVGSVYRVGPDHRITRLLSGVSIPNGVQWSADGSRVFHVDTPTQRVDTFDVDPLTGAWSRRRPHLWIERPDAFPDGMAIDDEEGLWVALWGAGAVNHYDATGRHIETIQVPEASQVTSCAFGGRDRSTLFITTSRQNLAPGDQPLAGSIFAVNTDFRGAVPAEFAG
jgi:hypothetical protein